MKVKFKVKESKIKTSELFEVLREILKDYWKSIEDAPFGAEYIEDKGYVELRHSTGNKWYIELSDDTVYLGYKGSRLGFYAKTPWIESVEFVFYDDSMQLFIEEKLLQKVLGSLPEKLYYNRIFRDPYLFLYTAYFELSDYYTTTPKKWDVKYYELVIPVIETLREEPTMAVIVDPHHGGYPLGLSIRKVVPYKNVYR